MELFELELNRPNKSVTWGFSIQGGKDFGCPLSVLRVTPNSISEKMGIRAEDFILKINDIPTDTLTHQQAILNIQNLNIKMELKRVTINDSSLPPPPIDVALNNSCRISTSITDLPPPPPEMINSNSNRIYEVNYQPPPPPPPESSVSRSKPIKEYEARQDTNQYTRNEPVITLNSENLSLFNQKLNEKNKESISSSLGQFLQAHNQEAKRDNKDLLISRPNFDTNVAICSVCKDHIKGAYIEANNKIYCSNHFCCSFCNKPIKGTQFIETKEGTLYCMDDFMNNVAPRCSRCHKAVVVQQVMALGKCWHPDCFLCDHCKKPIPQGDFHIKEENNQTFIYCESDFKKYYEERCFGCKLAIDADDKYVQSGNKNYHVECFKR